MQNMSQAAQGQLPPLPAIRKLVRRQGVRVQAPPPAPASLEHLIIPADSEYRLYEHQRGQFEPFLLAESEPRNDAILIFGRASNLDIPAPVCVLVVLEVLIAAVQSI